MINNDRYDLSENLIHFFRPFKAGDNSIHTMPELFGFSNIDEGEFYPALFLIRCAIRNCWIWSTWSFRGGERTVYGPYPATCFTEMPLAAFIETARVRSAAGQKISTYGLVFKKKEMYSIGARPVIYGLSNIDCNLPGKKNGAIRMIDESILGRYEQYRYVTYNPVGSYPVDWTHEREWRLPNFDESAIQNYENEIQESGLVEFSRDIPGFPLDSGSLTDIGVIVDKDAEIPLIIHDILVLVDRHNVAPDTYKFVLSNESITNIIALRNPAQERQMIMSSLIDLTPFFIPDLTMDAYYCNLIKTLEMDIEKQTPFESGENGGCWLWIYDNQTPFIRALVRDDKIEVNQDGKYLYCLKLFNHRRGLRQRENMCAYISDELYKLIGIKSGYFSVLNSFDCNGVPFYNDDNLDDAQHYNCTYTVI